MLQQGLSRQDIAKKLGIQDKAFLQGDLIRVDIPYELMENLQIPSSSATGANGAFVPGGKTVGGTTEGTISGPAKDQSVIKVTNLSK